VKNLCSAPRIALRNGQLRVPVAVGDFPIPARDFRQPGAPAANESRLFRNSETIVE
jgi:hypothetical protein